MNMNEQVFSSPEALKKAMEGMPIKETRAPTTERIPFAECVIYGLTKTILEIAKRMEDNDSLQRQGGMLMRETTEGPKTQPFPSLADYAHDLRLAVGAVSFGGYEVK